VIELIVIILRGYNYSLFFLLSEVKKNRVVLHVLDLTDSRQSLVTILDWRMQSDWNLDQSDL
jgi:hypothetical protein